MRKAAATSLKERMRAIGFAVACGLCWEPVLTGITQQFTREYTDSKAAKTVVEAQQLASGPAAASTPERAAAVAVDLVKTTPGVQNPVLKDQVLQQTVKLADQIDSAPSSDAKTLALTDLAVAAADAKNPQVLARSVKSLETIADSSTAQAAQARKALDAIHSKLAAIK